MLRGDLRGHSSAKHSAGLVDEPRQHVYEAAIRTPLGAAEL